ncbi:MAG: metallophosphoesterase [Candidatus Moranbacteria bacterium]|nr:metallophosphoesterase [Candidatus Moranbacteria bacterium]
MPAPVELEKKEDEPRLLKFSILADVHKGPVSYYKGALRKITQGAKEYLDAYIEEMNERVKPAFVMALGDIIEDDGLENDRRNLKEVIDGLKKLNCPVYYAAGNHDLRNVSEEELAQTFNREKLYYSFDSEDYHGIVLYSKAIEDKIAVISEDQLTWLKKDLESTDKRCLVFVHHGLSDQDMTGNPWFEGAPFPSLVENRSEVQKILEQSGKVAAVFQGHLHWDKMEVQNSIPYFTLQSPVENEDDLGFASEARHIVEVNGKAVSMEVRGRYPKKFRHEFSFGERPELGRK